MHELEKDRIEAIATVVRLANKAKWYLGPTPPPNIVPQPYTEDELARIREIAEMAERAVQVLQSNNPKGGT